MLFASPKPERETRTTEQQPSSSGGEVYIGWNRYTRVQPIERFTTKRRCTIKPIYHAFKITGARRYVRYGILSSLSKACAPLLYHTHSSTQAPLTQEAF